MLDYNFCIIIIVYSLIHLYFVCVYVCVQWAIQWDSTVYVRFGQADIDEVNLGFV